MRHFFSSNIRPRFWVHRILLTFPRNLIRSGSGSEGIANSIEVVRAVPNNEVELLPNKEEKLDNLDLDLLSLKAESLMQESAMLEEGGGTPRVEKSSKCW